MLMEEVTEEMYITWQSVFNAYLHKLRPNRKSPEEIIAFLKQGYVLSEIKEEKALETVTANILQNAYFRDKLPPGETPSPKVFMIEASGAGKDLYDQQEEVFKSNDILVGIDLMTGYFMVEGSGLLWDNLLTFSGLDGQDLNNVFLVAQYVQCLEKRGLLEKTLRDLADQDKGVM